MEPEIRRLAGFLFLGMNNSPIYDRPARRILREVIETWQGLAESGGESRYHELAASLVMRVRTAGGRITSAERALFEKAGLGIEFDRWWTRYAPRPANRAGKK